MKKLCACNPMGSGNGGGDLRGMQERAVNGRVVSKSMFCRRLWVLLHQCACPISWPAGHRLYSYLQSYAC